MILTDKIVMIEPRGFTFNEETKADNFFQSTTTIRVPAETAMKEFHEFKKKLMKAGIEVTIFTPKDELSSPDSVFPNNWFSTTPDGKFTVSLVECLGSCGTAPMMQIGFDYHEDLTMEKVDSILESCD